MAFESKNQSPGTVQRGVAKGVGGYGNVGRCKACRACISLEMSQNGFFSVLVTFSDKISDSEKMATL